MQWEVQWMRECFAKSIQIQGLEDRVRMSGKVRSSCEALRTFAYRQHSGWRQGSAEEQSPLQWSGLADELGAGWVKVTAVSKRFSETVRFGA